MSANTNAISQAFELYYGAMGSTTLATELSQRPFLDLNLGRALAVEAISDREILEAASHHGDIGAPKANLDSRALSEQAKVDDKNEALRKELLETGKQYKERHGIKYMICAKGKTGEEMLEILKQRLGNPTPQEWLAAREAMWQIFCKRLLPDPENQGGATAPTTATTTDIVAETVKKTGADSASLSVSWGARFNQLIEFDNDDGSNNSEQQQQQGQHPQRKYIQLGTFGRLSAAVFAMHALEQYCDGVTPTDKVNALLADSGSPLRIENGDELTIEDLVTQSALEPLPSDGSNNSNNLFDPATGLVNPTALATVIKVRNPKPTGSSFVPSDANYLVLQHILELFFGGADAKPSLMQTANTYFRGLFLEALRFGGSSYSIVDGINGPRAVPGVAAARAATAVTQQAASATTADFCGNYNVVYAAHRLLQLLGAAYHDVRGAGGDASRGEIISHDTARKLLYGFNKDFDYMNTDIGAGGLCMLRSVDNNKFLVHCGGTAANSGGGSRIFAMHCFDGADKGKGFVVASQCAASPGTADACTRDLAVAAIKQLGIRGVDVEGMMIKKAGAAAAATTSDDAWPALHTFYRDSILRFFTQERAEPIVVRGPPSDLLARSFLSNATVEFCTNDKFARAENLVSDHDPLFDPCLFGLQGKVMDSWESVRHNIREYDEAIFIPRSSNDAAQNQQQQQQQQRIRYVYLSTKYHTGNHTPVQAVSVLLASTNNKWQTLLPKINMNGHSYRKIDLLEQGQQQGQLPSKADIVRVRAEAYPDGGWTRLGLYSEEDLTADERKDFLPLSKHIEDKSSCCIKHPEPVPAAVKPLVEDFRTTKAEVAARIANLAPGVEFNVASQAYGAFLVSASDEHYAPATHALSPLPPAGMFDGFETARSRRPAETSYEELQVGLLRAAIIRRIEVDCTFFVNNAPKEIEIIGLAPVMMSKNNNGGSNNNERVSVQLVPRQKIKHFSGGVKEFLTEVACKVAVETLIVRTFPCGGFNRLRAFALPW